MKLLLATTNPHKIRELRSLLKSINGLDIYSLNDFPQFVPAEETGTTFEENAALKAVKAAKDLNMWALGEDSGLVIPALNGDPGVYSARYAGPNATDKENRKKLLKEMENFEGLARSAYFYCCMMLVSPAGEKHIFEGTCHGSIGFEERGGNGFGYDPLFIKHGYKLTFAEMDEMLKNQISHRGKAFSKLTLFLNRAKDF